jgi:hypothetical protein
MQFGRATGIKANTMPNERMAMKDDHKPLNYVENRRYRSLGVAICSQVEHNWPKTPRSRRQPLKNACIGSTPPSGTSAVSPSHHRADCRELSQRCRNNRTLVTSPAATISRGQVDQRSQQDDAQSRCEAGAPLRLVQLVPLPHGDQDDTSGQGGFGRRALDDLLVAASAA